MENRSSHRRVEDVQALDRPLLTIAIPTYNRYQKALRQAEFLLGEFAEYASQIEFIISDNASTDDTAVKLEEQLPHLEGGPRVVRNSHNLGLVGNLLSIIRQARGQFLWMVGDDDHLRPGILAAVFERLQAKPSCGLLFINHRAVDAVGREVLSNAVPTDGSARDLLDVFQHSGTSMMFITACVYRLELLQSAVEHDRRQRDRLAAPLSWSFNCAARGGFEVINEVLIDNVWGDTSWNASARVVFGTQVPWALADCRVLGYPAGKLLRIRCEYRWRWLRQRARNRLGDFLRFLRGVQRA